MPSLSLPCIVYILLYPLEMLSLKVANQFQYHLAFTSPQPVYSDWCLTSSLGSSLDSFVDEAASPRDPHNNTITFTTHHAQMAAYSPVEDKLYVNEEENLFAVFDGHGGGIFRTFYYLLACHRHTHIPFFS